MVWGVEKLRRKALWRGSPGAAPPQLALFRVLRGIRVGFLVDGEGLDLGFGFSESLEPFLLVHRYATLPGFELVPQVTGSTQSQRDLEDAFRILHPGSTELLRRSNDIRDAMHIYCAAKYAAQFLVTRDRGILKKSGQIRERFGLEVADPEQTLVHVDKAIDSTIRSHQKIQYPEWIPNWRP